MRMVEVSRDFLHALVTRQDHLHRRIDRLENQQRTHVPWLDPFNPPIDAVDGEVRISIIPGSGAIQPPI